ncbi:MAG: insulinase family protein [Erysipelotrichaceae bacterium]|jgi:Zn-dependent M16 (insulinase) family peptidase
MKKNDIIKGFKVEKVVESEELKATVCYLTHINTKAQLLYLDRDDDNKTFSIGFKTIPTDHTGVFHILEHSVLGGSEKYPLKEPFVDLLKSSLNTFLNAMTFPDKTVYPVSSRNDKDFKNLLRVYLDAVFNPLCLTNENIFRQEGWHYELNDKDEPVIYKGVVYNEMQGAYSTAEGRVFELLLSQMFPDTCYQYSSGGDPDFIPELTYEGFKAAHAKYYHPTNSMIFLDGKMNVEEILEIINDEYLSVYSAKDKEISIEKQKPVVSDVLIKEYAVPANIDTTNKALACFGFGLSDYNNYEINTAFQIISRVLAENNESVLVKALLEKGLAENVNVDVETNLLQPGFYMMINNTNKENYDEIVATIKEVLVKLVKEGINKEDLTAILNKMEFANKERDFGYAPKGIIYNIIAMSGWNYGGDPLDSLCNERVYKTLREKIDTDYFEKLIEKYLLNSVHHASVLMVPSTTIEAQKQQELENKLAEYKKSLSQQDIEDLISFNNQLLQWQSKEDSSEVKAMLPTLELSDIDEKPATIENEISEIDGVTVISYQPEAEGITYGGLYFNVEDLSLEDCQNLGVVIRLITELSSERHSTSELARIRNTYLGSFNITNMLVGHENDDGYKHQLAVTYSCLDNNNKIALDIVKEHLYDLLFTDEKAVLNVLRQGKAMLEMEISMAGHSYAINRAMASASEFTTVTEMVSGYSFYNYVKEMIDSFSKEKLERLQTVYKSVFTKNRLTLSVMSAQQQEVVKNILAAIEEDSRPVIKADREVMAKANEGIVIASGVGYAAMGANVSNAIKDIKGNLAVVNKVLGLDYLWNEIRAKGGAYGCGINSKAGNIMFYSFRDPNPRRSIDIYKKTNDYLDNFYNNTDNLDNYIIGTIGDSDPLLTAKTKMSTGNAEYFAGQTYQDKCDLRTQILSTTKEDFLKVKEVFNKVNQQAGICVVAGSNLLEQCKDIIDKTLDL